MNAYIVRDAGATETMERVHISDEIRGLQDLLERNHQLLPGDQINPEDPCRWLLIKREMPVPDPSTGGDRWNVDFFFVDQVGTPTFVECKRFNDTDSRRKIVGQVLDYAANGPYYWTKEMIHNYAKGSAPGGDLEKAWQELQSSENLSLEDFFSRIDENLKKGQIRIIFFLDEAPWGLKSIVNFLNGQMERSEVLLVEARQYSHGGVRIIVPSLFGYTEQARSIKRTDVAKPQGRIDWNWYSFTDQAQTNGLGGAAISAIASFYKAFEQEIFFGAGKTASMNVRCRSVTNASALSVTSTGVLYLNFRWLTGEKAACLREGLREVAKQLDLSVPDDYKNQSPSYQASLWSPKVDRMIELVRKLFTDCTSRAREGQ